MWLQHSTGKRLLRSGTLHHGAIDLHLERARPDVLVDCEKTL